MQELATIKLSLSRRPLYLQVRDHFVDLIASGEWQPGGFIGSESELAQNLSISVGTIRKALDTLEGEGLISRQQGRGTIVVDQRCEHVGTRLSNLRVGDGERVSGTVLTHTMTVVSADAQTAKRLHIAVGEEVYCADRVRQFRGHRFMYERMFMPKRLFPNMKDSDFALPRLVVEAARQHNMLVGKANERVSIACSDAKIAEALGISVGKPLLLLDRVTISVQGRPLEWRIAHCDLQEKYYMADIA